MISVHPSSFGSTYAFFMIRNPLHASRIRQLLCGQKPITLLIAHAFNIKNAIVILVALEMWNHHWEANMSQAPLVLALQVLDDFMLKVQLKVFLILSCALDVGTKLFVLQFQAQSIRNVLFPVLVLCCYFGRMVAHFQKNMGANCL